MSEAQDFCVGQARAERARESLERVSKSPKGPTRMLAAAQSEVCVCERMRLPQLSQK